MSEVIVISGGSDGIGKETARILSKKHQVVILARNEDKLKTVSNELQCDYEVCDVSKFEECKNTIEKILSKLGKIDCLINNAGIWIEGDLESNNFFDIEKIFAVNTLGTIYLTKSVLPIMRKQQSGQIINNISQGGLKYKKNRSIYYASKHAVTAFTKCLALDLENSGISISAIYPGEVRTNLFKKSSYSKDLTHAVDPIDVAYAIEFMIENNAVICDLGIVPKS